MSWARRAHSSAIHTLFLFAMEMRRFTGADESTSPWPVFNVSRDRGSVGALHRLFVNNHPIDAELVAELAKAMREKRFAHLHEDFSAFGERRVDALGLGIAVDRKGEISAAHGFNFGAVAGHHSGVAQREAC